MLKVMAAGHLLDHETEAPRVEILAGDLESVRSLFHFILYIGVV
jgi:hypothetical protein